MWGPPRDDSKCGPHGGQKGDCPPERWCSSSGWCGDTVEYYENAEYHAVKLFYNICTTKTTDVGKPFYD